MGEGVAALFEVHWGTVSLMELQWTLGALVVVWVALGAVWRSRGRSAYLRRHGTYIQIRANRDKLFRRACLGLALEIAVFLGLWSMLEPQAEGLTSSAAIAGLVICLIEWTICAVVIHEELSDWVIRAQPLELATPPKNT